MEKSFNSFVKISQKIHSILDLNLLLETIIDSAINVIGVERGILFLKTPEGNLYPRVVRNVEKEIITSAEEISRSIIKDVANSGQYYLSSNLLMDPNVGNRPSVKMFKILSVLCVPLISGNSVIGTIYLDSRKATKTFTDEDVQFMQAFANIAAVAIQNAKIYESTLNDVQYWQGEASKRFGFEKIIYESRALDEVCKRAQSVANSRISVLITGESGTGKELIARAIHYASQCRDKKFVPINCSALPEHILESELFGVKKGAYTGAIADKKGLFEEADGGTIFLDEIVDMQPTLQAKLLRVLQEGEIRRVGDTQFRYVDVRVISATNKNIIEEIQEGRFREDLYYRLCGLEISIPPLRERREDILPLASHFMMEFCNENKIPMKKFTKEALDALQKYAYPGNVRELQNIIRKAVLLSGECITEMDLDIHEIKLPDSDTEDFSEATRQHIIKVLEKVGWNQTRAAELLGLNRTTLQAKMKRLNISRFVE